jgi:ATP-dependent Clp protease ATP-binding subunit ClpA
MQLATQEALRLNHTYIDTEHILRGLINEGGGVAVDVLKSLGVKLYVITLAIEKCEQRGIPFIQLSQLPHTPQTKKVIESAMQEARILNDNYLGTEHLLLGLLREEEGLVLQRQVSQWVIFGHGRQRTYVGSILPNFTHGAVVLAAQVLMNLGLRLENVRAEIEAIPGRSDDERIS